MKHIYGRWNASCFDSPVVISPDLTDLVLMVSLLLVLPTISVYEICAFSSMTTKDRNCAAENAGMWYFNCYCDMFMCFMLQYVSPGGSQPAGSNTPLHPRLQ